MNQPRPLQSMVDDFLTQPPPRGARLAGAAPRQRFSPFRDSDAERASALAAEFGAIAGGAADRREALGLVVDRAQALRLEEDPELVDFAFTLFVTHDPRARGIEVTPLEVRAPDAVLPSPPPSGAGFAAAMPGREPELAWFREDAKANEHHDHWHQVFFRFGTPARRLKDRHGEMFFFMHQQMLARYDAERRALGIDPAFALTKYDDEIGEGYDPGPGFAKRPGPGLDGRFTPREAGGRIGAERLAELTRMRAAFARAVEAGELEGGVPITSDWLGLAVEPGGGTLHDGTPSPVRNDVYGNFHGTGHLAIGEMDAGAGVMFDTATAIRDPVFWRWHREVDNLHFEWQESLDEHRFEDDAPEGVRVRDTVLAFRDELPELADRAAGERFGEERFGGAAWGAAAGTDTLETMMCLRTLVDRSGEALLNHETGEPYTLPYLDQRPFVYFHRLENESAEPREVTVRVWLAPAEDEENRRAWIELDKFRYTLAAGQRAVVYRPAQESSVIRKPAHKPPTSYIDLPNELEGQEDEENYCSCGWPYNLLVPRGTEEGARYRLLVMVTDYAGDRVTPLRPAGRTCGSVSFCGLRDDLFPDRKPMGYPFHRAFRSRGIAATAAALPSFAVRDVTIRHLRSDAAEPRYHEAAPVDTGGASR